MIDILIIIQSILLIIVTLFVLFYIYKNSVNKISKDVTDVYIEKLLIELKAENDILKKDMDLLHTALVKINANTQSIDQIKEIICILGIWPKVDDLDPIRQSEELESILTTGFSYIKLSGRDVSRALIVNELSLETQINVTHIGAHGVEDGIYLSNDGKGEIVSAEWFGKVFYRHQVKVVLLFSCESQKIVDTIYRMDIPCVLGFRRDVNDKEVVDFIKEFYKYLQAYKDVKKAVEYAKLSSTTSNDFYDDIILRGNYIFE
jgi:hypothetical protein